MALPLHGGQHAIVCRGRSPTGRAIRGPGHQRARSAPPATDFTAFSGPAACAVRRERFALADVVHVGADLGRSLVALRWFFLKRSQHDVIESHVHADSLRWQRESTQRQLSCQHFVQDDAQ